MSKEKEESLSKEVLVQQIQSYCKDQKEPFSFDDLLDYLIAKNSNIEISHGMQKRARKEIIRLSEQKELLVKRLIDSTKLYFTLNCPTLQRGIIESSGSKFFIKDLETNKSYFIGTPATLTNCYDGDEALYVLSDEIDLKPFEQETNIDFAVIKSTEKPIVCRVTRDRYGQLIAVPENKSKYNIPEIEVTNLDKSLADAQLIAVKLIDRSEVIPKGECVSILGSADSVSAQVKAAILKYDIPSEWSDEVKAEASTFSEEISEKDRENRVDLTHIPLFTIDGEDSRDFDDAVYCEPLDREEKGWKLYVAIADVSYYVRKHSAIDKEAYKRGNSVYFPDTVVPMLPEILSNGLCSLNPNIDRLCMVSEMIIDRKGMLESYRFYPAVMHSHARMTYTKIHNILEGNQSLIEEYNDLYPHIINLYELYKCLDQARKRRSAIEFESEEIKFIFDENRFIEDLYPVVRNEAHKLIEECMIMANVAAARFIEEHEELTVFRIHPNPIAEKVDLFRKFIAKYGLTLGGGDKPSTRDYAEFLKQIDNREDQATLNLMMLRSLAKAEYSPNNCGHFGLALKQYAHFTSPIRRYPDLMLHREIKYLLEADQAISYKNIGEQHYEVGELNHKGEHCSDTERRADAATYEVEMWLKCQFMEDKIGNTFEGIVTNVASFGVFVMLDDWHIDGLIYVGNLGHEFFVYDADAQTLIGSTTHTVYKIGDKLKVVVDSIDLNNKRINFLLPKAKISKNY